MAIKILPHALSADPVGRQRMEREARLIASINHPHVCALYDVGRAVPEASSTEAAATASAQAVDYLVMEYLEGETLAERLSCRALSLGEALRHAIEIADALDTAHRRGIVHRDLKPGNVMLTREGTKLLDFGVAKSTPFGAGADAAGATETPTRSGPLTGRGMIIGTVQYMAPEQLEGREVDARTDLFAFGAVLYEMLSGRRAFDGPTQASLIGSIMSAQPAPLTGESPALPAQLVRIVHTCLEKRPEDRWQSTADLLRELRWIERHWHDELPRVGRPWPSTGILATRAAVVGLAIATAGVVGFVSGRPGPTDVVTRVSVELPGWRPSGPNGLPRLSPDGRKVVFTAVNSEGVPMLWVRELNAAEPRPLMGTELAWHTFWAPDSRSLGFMTSRTLKRVDLNGASPIALAEVTEPRGGSWGPDGTIVFAGNSSTGLSAIPAIGGSVRPLTTLNTARFESGHRWPHFLPDGRHVLYVARSNDYTQSAVWLTSLDSREAPRLILPLHTEAVANRLGHLLFVRDGVLTAQRFDLGSFSLAGDAIAIASGVMFEAANGGASISLSDDGTLAYMQGPGQQVLSTLREFDRSGTPTGPVTDSETTFEDTDPQLSPDETALALTRVTPQGDRDIWIVDRQRRTSTRLTSSPFQEYNPVWSPDGSRVAYFSNRDGEGAIYAKSMDGREELLLRSQPSPFPYSWSPDGKFLLYGTSQGQEDLWLLPLEGDRRPRPYLTGPFMEGVAEISPDGHLVAYVENDTGRPEIYLQSFPTPGAKVRVSSAGGFSPRWSRDGRELFYVTRIGRGSDIWSVPIRIGPSPAVGEPRLVLERGSVPFGGFAGSGGKHSFAVARDGHLIASVPTEARSVASSMNLILNWPALLRAR